VREYSYAQATPIITGLKHLLVVDQRILEFLCGIENIMETHVPYYTFFLDNTQDVQLEIIG
jgi:hypothetical protein